MRIAVVNNFFPPRPGGSSHLSEHLAIRYARAGHTVLVITASYGGASAEELRDGLRIVRIPAWTLPKSRLAANFDIGFTMSPRSMKRIAALLDDFQPDVVHQHGQFFDLTWQSGLWARRRGVPTLLSIHTRLESPLSRFNSAVYGLADMLLVKPLMMVHRPRLVVMDVLMDKYIDRRYRRAISGKVVIPVGIDPEVMRGGDGAAVREKYGLKDRHVIVSLGHVIPQRSRIALVKALPKILEEFPTTAVVVIGGVYHDEFLGLARELGVDHAITCVGARPQHEIPDFLAMADLEVHELEGGGFGTASLESLAVGIPVVAAIRPENFIEVELRDREHLYLAPFKSESDERADPDKLADVILGILRDPAAAKALVEQNAKNVVNDFFTLDRVVERHIDVLRAITTESR